MRNFFTVNDYHKFSETNLSYEHTKDNLSNGIRNERFYSCNTTRKNASNFDNVLEKTSQNSVSKFIHNFFLVNGND